jgi:uncharacterized protein (DUF1778 family)
MTDERKDAAYYEAHKDDPDEWGDATPSGKPRRRLASMFSVRLAPTEADLVRREAENRGMSVSAFLRTAALAEANKGRPVQQTVALPMTTSSSDLTVTIESGFSWTEFGADGGIQLLSA